MSFNPIKQPIDPFKLISDTLAQIAPIYVTLLIIASPGILVSILQEILPQALKPIISIVYGLILAPIIGGVGIYFCYRYLKQGTIDLGGAIEKALSHSGQLILGAILYFLATMAGLICLVIPGFYILVRFGFVLYAIIAENCSAIDGFKYSSKLVAGRWWAVFGSLLVVILFFIPLVIITIILGVIFVKQPLVAAIISTILSVLWTPVIMMYYVKLYLRLQETTNLNSQLE